MWQLRDQQHESENQSREGRCPSCGKHTVFHLLGEQHWPQRVVEATGCPPVILLWTCDNCLTTVSDANIES